MASGLKKCPKCGDDSIKVYSMGGKWVVHCEECGYEVTGKTREEAIKNWNAS